MSDAARRELLDILVRRSYLREAGKTFTLASGRQSEYYIECSLTTTFGAAMPLIGALVHGCVPAGITAVGGPTMGADPIAAATAYHSAGTGRPLSWFSVRKTAKEHGRPPLAGGIGRARRRVVVVEDVITSGGSSSTPSASAGKKAWWSHRARGAGRPRGTRRPGRGRGRARAEGADLMLLFTRAELEHAWQAGRASA